jgi:hypothetical protein
MLLPTHADTVGHPGQAATPKDAGREGGVSGVSGEFMANPGQHSAIVSDSRLSGQFTFYYGTLTVNGVSQRRVFADSEGCGNDR